MGCLFGARLSAQAEVTLIGGWPDQLQALGEAPLRFVHPDGHEEFIRLKATSDSSMVEPVDTVLIVTKTPKTELAAQQAARLLKPGGLVISLQNGLGNQEVIARFIPAWQVTLGVTTLGASTGGRPGVVYWNGSGSTSLAARPDIDRPMREIACVFERGGLKVDVAEDVSSLVWGKLAVNAAINPLTALLRVPNGELIESEWARQLMHQAAQEVTAVAAAQNISLPFPDPAAQVDQVARLTARNTSSMLQDVLRGVETEIETICGAVVRAGAAAGIETPTNQMLYGLVKAIQDTYTARM